MAKTWRYHYTRAPSAANAKNRHGKHKGDVTLSGEDSYGDSWFAGSTGLPGSVKKPHCPRDAKQWGRNREEAESNVITVTHPEIAVKRNLAKITNFSAKSCPFSHADFD